MSCRGTHRLRWCGSSVGSDTSWKVQLIAVKPVWTKPMMQIKMSGNAIFGYIAQRKLVAFLLASSSMSIESVGWSRLVLLSEYIANSMGNFRKELVGCACTFTAILLETVLSALSFLMGHLCSRFSTYFTFGSQRSFDSFLKIQVVLCHKRLNFWNASREHLWIISCESS